jgi:hypothetical protein
MLIPVEYVHVIVAVLTRVSQHMLAHFFWVIFVIRQRVIKIFVLLLMVLYVLLLVRPAM